MKFILSHGTKFSNSCRKIEGKICLGKQKKVLSLVLCVAMMLSVMVVGAGAAFSDQSKIKNTEAVDMCTALNIIGGYPDGTFKPEGNITRAEVTKMICVALNGGEEPAVSTNATPTFSDVRGNANAAWAEGYIESCATQGIVSGVGGGKFAPNGNVTGTQLAKMLLVALGYKADIQNFTGNAWATNVNVLATQKGLYKDLEKLDVSAALTRDNAAQMIWNALQAKEVTYEYTLVSENGQLTSKITVKDDKKTLLEDKYNTVDTDKTTGILTGISYNTNKEEYTYTIQDLDSRHALTNPRNYTTKQDFTELLGHNVTIVVENNSAKDVYGAYAKDSVVLVSGLMGDIGYDDYAKDKTIEVNDVDYDVDAQVTAVEYSAVNHRYVESRIADLNAVKAKAPFYKFSAIDWDDDNDIDLIIVYPVAFGKVTYVGSDYTRVAVVNAGVSNFNNDNPTTTSTSYDTKKAEDYTLYSGAAKDDYAVISADTSLKTRGTITKVDKQTGKVTSTSKDTAVIGGTSYDITYQTALKNSRNETVDYRVVNGYVVWSDSSATVDVSDYVLVTGITGSTASSGYYKADLLFTDGTTATADIKSVKDGDNTYTKADENIKNKATAGTLWKYEVSSGRYELTALPDSGNDKEGFDLWLKDASASANAHWTHATKASDADAKVKFGSQSSDPSAKFAKDAVVFVKDDDDYSVKTGADLAKVTGNATVFYAGAEENDNGYNYVTFAFISTTSISSTDTIYGFVTSDVTITKDSDGTYYGFTAWNGTETVNLTTIDTNSGDFKSNSTNLGEVSAIEDGTANLKKQAIIGYKLDADGKVTDLTVYGTGDANTVTTGLVGALTAFDGDDLTVNGVPYTTDKDDTTILYIDRDGKKGETSGSYSKADEVDSSIENPTSIKGVYNGGNTKYYANVLILKAAGSSDLDLIVVDVNNDWYNVQ